MTWEAWVLVVLFVVGALFAVSAVDKPRKPLSSNAAVVVLVLDAAQVWLVLRLAGVA